MALRKFRVMAQSHINGVVYEPGAEVELDIEQHAENLALITPGNERPVSTTLKLADKK